MDLQLKYGAQESWLCTHVFKWSLATDTATPLLSFGMNVLKIFILCNINSENYLYVILIVTEIDGVCTVEVCRGKDEGGWIGKKLWSS